MTAGALTAVLATLSDLLFWVQQQSDESGAEGIVNVVTAGSLLAALTALLTGLFVLAAGLVTRRRRLVRLGLLAVLLSQTLWLAIWLTTLM
jgi:hypothetical protein